MRSRRHRLAVGSATAVAGASCAALLLSSGFVDVVVMAVVIAALAGLYLLHSNGRSGPICKVMPAMSIAPAMRRNTLSRPQTRRPIAQTTCADSMIPPQRPDIVSPD
ncbi:MAG TPA: hypothetical protein DGT23_29565 [Micromonosporaceae bacterium]|nr:hypothetical protein [Micromonosporaceae bacterium]